MRPFACILAAALAVGAAACGSSARPGENAHDASTACLEEPGLQRPPDGRLPCELLPPGFSTRR